ncbi:hypothetical protein FKM82_005204 [Ascaphus truei]
MHLSQWMIDCLINTEQSVSQRTANRFVAENIYFEEQRSGRKREEKRFSPTNSYFDAGFSQLLGAAVMYNIYSRAIGTEKRQHSTEYSVDLGRRDMYTVADLQTLRP